MRLLTLLLVAISCATDSAPAQSSRGHRAPTRVPVTIALVERLPQPDAPFVILRNAETAPHDVILLPADADARQLSIAVQALLTARAVGGDTAATTATLRVRPRGRPSNTHRQFPWVVRVLADLRRTTLRSVPGVGIARAVVIWLPPQRRRATL